MKEKKLVAAVAIALSCFNACVIIEREESKNSEVPVSETSYTSFIETTGTSAIVTSRAETSGVTSYTSNSTTTEETTVTEPYSVIYEETAEPVTEPPVNEVQETEEPVIIQIPVEIEFNVEPEETEEPVVTEPLVVDKESMTYVKRFSRGTYYPAGPNAKGGSTRYLIDCSKGDGTVKGSVASSYLYTVYDYDYNGSRTLLYLEVYDKKGVRDFSDMNGYYYLDDSDNWNPNVIDFFYEYEDNCPFKGIGVVDVECWVVE